jgi:antitoxin component of MazEF toxin-antitoxin module
METIKCFPRKWGNSLGVTIPKEIVEKEGIVSGKPVIIQLNPRADIWSIFGTAKFKKTAQQMKDEERRGWD